MTARHRTFRRSATLVGLAIAALLGSSRSGSAQYATSIPYMLYSNPYQSFSYPVYTNPALPNMGRFAPGYAATANQFSQIYSMDQGAPEFSPFDLPGTAPARGGRYVPYYNVYRRYDQELGRTYVPNDTKADSEFFADQQKRQDLYFQAMRERDPRKRAELLRQAERYTARREAFTTPRGGPTSGRAPSARTSPETGRTPAPTTRTPSLPSTPSAPAADSRGSINIPPPPPPLSTPYRSGGSASVERSPSVERTPSIERSPTIERSPSRPFERNRRIESSIIPPPPPPVGPGSLPR